MRYSYYQGVSKGRANTSVLVAAAVTMATVMLFAILAQTVSAITSTVVVTPGNTQGWSTADTRTAGEVDFVADADTPFGTGALSLITGSTVGQDKAQYLHSANVALADVTELSYYTKQVSASFVAGLPSYQLLVDVDGTVGDGQGFTTLVYEPYNNFGNAAVLQNTWQSWDVDAGTFWSSRSVGGLTAGFGGAPFYSLSDVLTLNPNAVAIGFGVNVGSNNPDWDTRADGVVFNGTLYDFEVAQVAASTKDECKNGGWMNFQAGYKNQGQCVASVQSNENSKINRQ